MSPQQSIGVFDSGLGGLSVLKEIRHHLPAESLIYVADNAHAPYGEKSSEYILQRVRQLGAFFQQQNVKAMVVACNTATSAAVHELRDYYDCPVIGMEPAIKPAVSLSSRGVVGVLATTATLAGSKFSELVEQQPQHVRFLLQACPGLVELVESGDIHGEVARRLIAKYVQPLLDQGADTLVLGCTHYPFLRDVITALVGEQVHVIDPNKAVVRHLRQQLQDLNLLATNPQPRQQYWQSADLHYDQAVLQELYGEPLQFEPMPVAFR
jgi:glutamate racemase